MTATTKRSGPIFKLEGRARKRYREAWARRNRRQPSVWLGPLDGNDRKCFVVKRSHGARRRIFLAFTARMIAAAGMKNGSFVTLTSHGDVIVVARSTRGCGYQLQALGHGSLRSAVGMWETDNSPFRNYQSGDGFRVMGHDAATRQILVSTQDEFHESLIVVYKI